jgi:NAD(P)H-hydrate epimerase
MALERREDSHKGENGKVAVIGGSKDFTGAPSLSAQAALRSGADLVKILVPESIKDVVAGYSENLIVEGYKQDYFGEASLNKAEEVFEWADVIVAGPGLGSPDQNALEKFLGKTEKPKVIDADAIPPGVTADVENAVFTPHSGEAEIMEESFGSIERFIEERKDLVVLEKGPEDRIYSESGAKRVSAGHPGMAVGGTGDVLTGIVAALIAQGFEKKEAAVKAAEVNGKAGERATERYGNGMLATDLLEEIPKVLFKS